MLNVIELDAIESENMRKVIARKILSARAGMHYAELLEQLRIGGAEYISTENEHEFQHALSELKGLGVEYRTIKREPPAPPEQPKTEPPKVPQIIESVVPKPRAPTPTQFVPKTEHIEVKEEIRRAAPNIKEQKPKRQRSAEEIQKTKNIVTIVLIIIAFVALMFALSMISERKQKEKTDIQFEHALTTADNACVEGAFDTEKMYRAAISFNKNNMNAWVGLLHCFEKKGDTKKVAEVRKEMMEVFGGNIWEITEFVSAFGTVEDFSTEDNVCKLSYNRYSNSEEIEWELFSVGYGVVRIPNIDKAVILAKNGKDKGYSIAFSTADFPKTFEEFQEKIVINKVE